MSEHILLQLKVLLEFCHFFLFHLKLIRILFLHQLNNNSVLCYLLVYYNDELTSNQVLPFQYILYFQQVNADHNSLEYKNI